MNEHRLNRATKLIANTYVHHGEVIYRLWAWWEGWYKSVASSPDRKELLRRARQMAEHMDIPLSDET